MTPTMKRGGLYAALVLGLLVALFALASIAEAAAPEARIDFSKTAARDGDTITWTLTVTNSGGAESSSQTIEDFLPPGNWVLGTRTIDCDLADGNLYCEPFTVPASSIDANNDKVNGVRYVTIKGIVRTCGSLTNDAYLVDQSTGALTIRSASIAIPCPTATPSTPTNTPTATTTPTVSAEPTVIRVIPSVTPLPPRTGNTQPYDDGPFIALRVAAILIGMAVLIVLFAGYVTRRK